MKALQTKFGRIPRDLTYTVNEKRRAEDRSELDVHEISKLEVEEGHMKKINKATNPRRTARIKGAGSSGRLVNSYVTKKEGHGI